MQPVCPLCKQPVLEKARKELSLRERLNFCIGFLGDAPELKELVEAITRPAPPPPPPPPPPTPTMPREGRRLYTVEAVAEMTNLTRKTVYEHIRAGKLEAVRFGRTLRVESSALDAWLKAHTKPEKGR